LRQLVTELWGIPAGAGNYWLPIIATLRGSVFAEVIGQNEETDAYIQPIHLNDRQRQPLYRLGFQLLNHLQAPPSVYLLQFGWSDSQSLLFDRLIPFPDTPAIASVGVQSPDLFACHWLCLTEQPLPEIITCAPKKPEF
jgi:hypothetical protein